MAEKVVWSGLHTHLIFTPCKVLIEVHIIGVQVYGVQVYAVHACYLVPKCIMLIATCAEAYTISCGISVKVMIMSSDECYC